jgi:hypothetical protein
LLAVPFDVCPGYVDQAVRGLQVLGSASIGQLLVTGLDTCNAAAAAAAAARSPNLQAGSAGSSADRSQRTWRVDELHVPTCVAPLEILQLLCKSPAAQELPAAAVQQLLPALAALMREQTRLLRYGVELHMSHADAQVSWEDLSRMTGALSQGVQNMHAWIKLVQQLLALPSAQQVMLQHCSITCSATCLQPCQQQALKDSISAAQVRTAAACFGW